MTNEKLFYADVYELTWDELREMADEIIHECNKARVGQLNAAKDNAYEAESLVARVNARSCVIHEHLQRRNDPNRWENPGTIPHLKHARHANSPDEAEFEAIRRGIANSVTVLVDETLVDDWHAFKNTYQPMMESLIPDRRILIFRNTHTDEWDMPGIHIRDSEAVVENAELIAMLLEDAEEITYQHDYTVRLGINDVRTRNRGDSASKHSRFIGPNIADDLTYWREMWADEISPDFVPNMMGYAGGTIPGEDYDVMTTDPVMGLRVGSRARKPAWRPTKIDSRDKNSEKRDSRRHH